MKLYLKYFSIQLKSVMQYKTSFFLTSIGQCLTTFFSFLSMYFLFTRFGSIKNYSFNEVLLCFSTIFMSFALAECFGRGFDAFPSIISDGSFDRILVRPRNEVLQVLGTKIELTRIGRLIEALIVFIYSLKTCGVYFSPDKIFTLALMIIGGTFLFFGLFIISAVICFFTIESLEIINIFTDGGRELAQYPLDIYKNFVLKFFTYIIPLAFVNYYPLLYIIGKSHNVLYMFSPIIACLFIIPSFILWKFGVRHYVGTGS
ncbi:ABC transporter permease [Clostridium hydrogenum]|uniref:ABC transporter permease n=1 Tax=Clostridium hydrogenum TaxID=2855764 RepID=UPI001F2A7EFD|nr:ABC-2 family transporter protein [Clostridium hydrogenum]